MSNIPNSPPSSTTFTLSQHPSAPQLPPLLNTLPLPRNPGTSQPDPTPRPPFRQCTRETLSRVLAAWDWIRSAYSQSSNTYRVMQRYLERPGVRRWRHGDQHDRERCLVRRFIGGLEWGVEVFGVNWFVEHLRRNVTDAAVDRRIRELMGRQADLYRQLRVERRVLGSGAGFEEVAEGSDEEYALSIESSAGDYGWGVGNVGDYWESSSGAEV